jgi:hypothetical protein
MPTLGWAKPAKRKNSCESRLRRQQKYRTNGGRRECAASKTRTGRIGPELHSHFCPGADASSFLDTTASSIQEALRVRSAGMRVAPFKREAAGNPWHDVDADEKLPTFNVVIEIPFGSSNKYELDKKSGLLRLDRVLYSAVYYPANYASSRRHSPKTETRSTSSCSELGLSCH